MKFNYRTKGILDEIMAAYIQDSGAVRCYRDFIFVCQYNFKTADVADSTTYGRNRKLLTPM